MTQEFFNLESNLTQSKYLSFVNIKLEINKNIKQ